MSVDLTYKVNSEISLIGKKLLQNKKFDFQNPVNYSKFVQLVQFKNLLEKFCVPNTIDLSQLSFDETTIFNTIKTIAYSR